MRQERLWSTNSATLCTAKWSTTLTSSPQKVSTASSSCPPYFFTSACEDSYRVHLGSISWPNDADTYVTNSVASTQYLLVWYRAHLKHCHGKEHGVKHRQPSIKRSYSGWPLHMPVAWIADGCKAQTLKSQRLTRGLVSPFPWNALESWNIQIYINAGL